VGSTVTNTFTWIAYASSADGATNFTTGAWNTGGIERTYLGIAVNKLTAAESTNPADYAWQKFVGATGATGSSGLNTARPLIYQRAASAPALPSAATTYTFSTTTLTGLTNGWTTAIPADNGQPCWVSSATASSTTDTDSIAANEWAAAV
jgi:hypothetical protein